MNGLPKFQSIVAPLAAPIAPAVLLANEIYTVMIELTIPNWIALISSIVGIAGIDFSGALMCIGAVRAWRRRSWGLFGVSIVGAIVYALIVYVGIASMPHERGRVFGVMIFLTLVAYAGYAIFTVFEEESAIDAKATQAKADASQAEIDRLNAENRLTNARTRQIKAGGSVQTVQSVQSNTEQTAESDSSIRITALGQRIIDALGENPDRSLREIADAVGGCSPATVKEWKSKWETLKRAEEKNR